MAAPMPADNLNYRTIELEKIPFSGRLAISAAVMKHAKFDSWFDSASNRLMHEISTHVWGNRAIYEEEIEVPVEVSIEVPIRKGWLRRAWEWIFGKTPSSYTHIHRETTKHKIKLEMAALFPDFAYAAQATKSRISFVSLSEDVKQERILTG